MIQKDLKWYQKKKGILILLVFFFPVGIYQMWKHSDYWSKTIKFTITLLFIVILGIGSKESDNTSYPSNKCLLKGCNNEGIGWIHSSQSSEMRINNLYGVYRIKETGGYCSKSHGIKDN